MLQASFHSRDCEFVFLLLLLKNVVAITAFPSQSASSTGLKAFVFSASFWQNLFSFILKEPN